MFRSSRTARSLAWGLTGAALLHGQAWTSWYSAYEDGLAAQERGDPAAALVAFQFAAAHRPEPGAKAKTYALNFIAYFPYLKIAECSLALGDLDRCDRALRTSARFGLEPAPRREALARQLAELRSAAVPRPAAASTPEVNREEPKPRAAPPLPAAVAPPPLPRPSPRVEGKESLPRALQEPARPRTEPHAPVSLPKSPVREPHRTPRPIARATPQEGPPPVPPPVHPSGKTPIWFGAGAAATLVAAFLFLWKSGRMRFRRRGLGSSRPAGRLEYAGTHRQAADGRASEGHSSESPEATTRYRQLGPYVLLHPIGSGGSASTYLALHQPTGRKVALKVPHPHLLADSEFLTRFRREAELGAVLDHPRIVRIFDSGPGQGATWIALEFVEGKTLQQRLKERKPLPVPEVIRTALEIADALSYAHGRGVVHRDLKPENVMVTREGAKVMDFGIARRIDMTITSTSAFLGTPAYSAPEAMVDPRVGPAADRYALGIMLFEMLAGKVPFQGETGYQVLLMHREAPLPDLRGSRPVLPTQVVGLVERLCSKDPQQRPEDDQVLEILHRELARLEG